MAAAGGEVLVARDRVGGFSEKLSENFFVVVLLDHHRFTVVSLK